MARVLELPASQREIVTWLMRRSASTIREIATHLDQDELAVRLLLQDLLDQGFVTAVETPGERRYSARPGARSQRTGMPPDVWQNLEGLSPQRRGRRK